MLHDTESPNNYRSSHRVPNLLIFYIFVNLWTTQNDIFKFGFLGKMEPNMFKFWESKSEESIFCTYLEKSFNILRKLKKPWGFSSLINKCKVFLYTLFRILIWIVLNCWRNLRVKLKGMRTGVDGNCKWSYCS